MKNICLASHIVSVAHRNLIVSSAIKHFANYKYIKHVTSNIIIDIYLTVVAVVVNAAHCSLFTSKFEFFFLLVNFDWFYNFIGFANVFPLVITLHF